MGDARIGRRAVDMHIEDVHEHRDAGEILTRQIEFGRRHDILDRADAAIGGDDGFLGSGVFEGIKTAAHFFVVAVGA